MIKRQTYRDLIWVNLESPTADEIRTVMQEFDLHPIVGEELLINTSKPKVDLYKNYIYLILHFPTLSRNEKESHTGKEIDFVVGKNFIITTAYDTVEPLHNFSKIFEVNAILDKSEIGEHAGFIFYYMIKKLYRSMGQELDHIQASLHKIEGHIFNGESRKMVKDLSEIGHDLLDFKQAAKSHGEVLESFAVTGEKFFGSDFSYYLNDIISEYRKTYNAIENNRDFLTELRDTNNSLVSTQQNEVVKKFTVLAFLTLPLSLIASIFTIPTTHTPVVGNFGDFWIILATMIAVSICMFSYFKYKDWI
jgi:magnesium transporter